MIKAILFDVDGVIFDSEKYIQQAYYNYYKVFYGKEIDYNDLLPYVGTGEAVSIRGLGESLHLAWDVERDKAGIYAEYDRLIQGVLKPMPGVRRFIDNARRAGLKLALATSADRTKLNSSMMATGLEPELFDSIVSGDMVVRTKPDGAIYRYAAGTLALPNDQCLVIEDALSGHIAAKNAGSPGLGVTGSFEEEKLILSGADLVIRDLSAFPSFSDAQQFNDIFESMCLEFRGRTVPGKLLDAASKVIENSYSPYSHFPVGAALLTQNGGIYSGCNVENSSFGGTICAERGAAMTALGAGGKTEFTALAVVSDSEEPAPPCAICRQFLSEFAGPDMQIYLLSRTSGKFRHMNFGSIMPFTFELKSLN